MVEKSTDAPTASGNLAQDALADMQKAGFGSVAGLGSAWVEQLSDVGAEWLSFVADRIKQDVATQHQILHCKDIGELQKIQTEFFRKAVDQYQAETGKLVELSANLLAKTTGDKADDKKGGRTAKGHTTPV